MMTVGDAARTKVERIFLAAELWKWIRTQSCHLPMLSLTHFWVVVRDMFTDTEMILIWLNIHFKTLISSYFATRFAWKPCKLETITILHATNDMIPHPTNETIPCPTNVLMSYPTNDTIPCQTSDVVTSNNRHNPTSNKWDNSSSNKWYNYNYNKRHNLRSNKWHSSMSIMCKVPNHYIFWIAFIFLSL